MSEVMEQGAQAAPAKAKKPTMEVSGTVHEDGHLSIEVKHPSGKAHEFHFDASHPLYQRFALHGVSKKLRDTVATIKEDADKEKAAEELFASLQKGVWNPHRSEAGSGSSHGVLARALAALYGKTLDEAQEFVGKLSKKQQSDMRRVPAVAAKITELQAEKGVSEDVGNLLDSFAS